MAKKELAELGQMSNNKNKELERFKQDPSSVVDDGSEPTPLENLDGVNNLRIIFCLRALHAILTYPAIRAGAVRRRHNGIHP